MDPLPAEPTTPADAQTRTPQRRQYAGFDFGTASHSPAPSTAVHREPAYPTGQPVTPPASERALMERSRFLRSPATYLLIGINAAVFLWMVRRGVSPLLPEPEQLLRFGANNAGLVLHGQWWRIITAMFVHVGIAHLLTNMWCLWNLGLLGEPLLGFFGVCAVYLLTGAAGNLLSLAAGILSELLERTPLFFLVRWTGAGMDQVGAGASGAVFGIAGILIVLLSNRRLAEFRADRPGIPLRELQALRRSVVNFAGINLLIGLGSTFLPLIRIDNMAHMGGFGCGLFIGLPLLSQMTNGRRLYLQRQRLTFAGSALILALLGAWLSKLHG